MEEAFEFSDFLRSIGVIYRVKKVFSIFFLLIFLFNVGGYYIVFWGLRMQTDNELNYRLEANLYEPEETIQLRIPIALPYPIQSQGFQRVDGRFEHQGQHYKLVKQKLQNDTLYVVCIRDHATRQLVSTMTNYMVLTQGFEDNNRQKAMNYLSKVVKDFCGQDAIAIQHESGYCMLIPFTERPCLFAQLAVSVHAPPPRV